MKNLLSILSLLFFHFATLASTVTMTSTDAWNIYKTDGKTPIRSFVDGEHWSDHLPPHPDADYVLATDSFSLNIHANEKNGGQTFAGKSLSLNGSSTHIYLHWNMQRPETCWNYPVTISNLTFSGVHSYIYGENSTFTTNRYVLRGKFTILGTESAWPQHLENSKGNGSWMYVESKLIGAPQAFFAVRTLNRLSINNSTHYAIPDPNDPTKPSETALTGADFRGDLSEFFGTLYAGTNSAIRLGDNFPGSVRLSGKWSAMGSAASSRLDDGSIAPAINVANIKFVQNGILLASDQFAPLAVTNSFVINGPLSVRLFEPKNLAYLPRFEILKVPLSVTKLSADNFILDSDDPNLSLEFSIANGVQTLSLCNAAAVKFEPYREIKANSDNYNGKNDYINRLRENFIDNYQPQIAAQFSIASADAFYAPGTYHSKDIQGNDNTFPFWCDGLAPHPGADYVVYPEIWAPNIYERSLIAPRGVHIFAGDSLIFPDHTYLGFTDTPCDTTIHNLRLLDGGSIRLFSNNTSQNCILRGSLEIVASATNPARIQLKGRQRNLEIASDIFGDENSMLVITCDSPDSFVSFSGDLSNFKGKIVYPYESNPSFVQLKNSDPTTMPPLKDRSQLAYFYAGGWADGKWPHSGTNYYVGADKLIAMYKTSSIASSNCVDRGLSATAYWQHTYFYGDILAIAGTLYFSGDTSNNGYAFTIPDLRLLGGAKLTFPNNYPYDTYLDYQANGATKLRIESTPANPVVIEGTRSTGKTLFIGMSLIGDKNASLRIVNQDPLSGGRSTVHFTGEVGAYQGSIIVGNNMNLLIDRPFRGKVILEGNATASYLEFCADSTYDDVLTFEVADSAALAATLIDLRARRMQGEFAAGLPVAITLKPGDYFLDSTLEIAASDSGRADAPLIFRAETPGTVRILGAIPFSADNFSPLDPNDPWFRVFPSDSTSKIQVLDASSLLPHDLPIWKVVNKITGAPWLFADGHFQDLSRYPNRLDDERYYGTAVTNCLDIGDNNGGAILQLSDRRPNNWNFARGDIYIHGYYRYLWHEDYVHVSRWDKASNAVTLDGKPTYQPLLGKPSYDSIPVCFLNLPEELDYTEEWWLDRNSQKLYYIPRPGATEFAIVADTYPLMRFARTAHDIRFENITFAYAYQAFTSSTNLKRITFANCSFHSLVETSELTGDNCRITNCDFSYLGCGGVKLTGGDRNTLTRGDNLVDFCSFRDFERLEQCNAPGASINGCGNAVRNCSFREAGHQGVFYKGNESFVGWSIFDKVVRLNEDCGAIYTGRDTAALGSAVVGCSFSNLAGYNRNAVYYDDCNYGDATYGCTFRNIYRAIHIGGGNIHRTKWNACYNCSIALHLDSRGYSRLDFVTSDQWWAETAAKYPSSSFPWTAAYPDYLEIIADHPAEAKYNHFESLYLANCAEWTTITLKKTSNYFPVYSNGMSMASIVTVSTNGVAGTGFPGWTHYNWNAGTDKVPGLDAALERIAAQSNNYSRVRCFPNLAGDITLEVGVSANERLCLSAKFRGNDFLSNEPLYGAISCYKDYARFVRPAPASITTAGGAQTLKVPLFDYIDDDRSAILEVKVDSKNQIAYRFVSTNNLTLVDWRALDAPTADIRANILYVDVPTNSQRPLNAAEIAALTENSVTNLVKTGHGVLILDQPLTGYTGAWTKQEGAFQVSAAINPFGSASDCLITINDDLEYPQNITDLEILCSCTIDRPIHFNANDSWVFSIADNQTVRFTKLITMSGNCPRSYCYTGSTCIIEGGLSSSILFTCNGPGTFIFNKTPINVAYIWLENSNCLVFNSISNVITQISCSTITDGSTIIFNNPLALKPNTCRLSCYNSSSTWINDYSKFKTITFSSGVKPLHNNAYFEADNLTLPNSVKFYTTQEFSNITNLAPTDIELFRGYSTLNVDNSLINSLTDSLPSYATAWRRDNSIFAHIPIPSTSSWQILDGGTKTNSVFSGMLIQSGTLNLGSDWIAKTITGSIAFDSFNHGFPKNDLFLQTRMTSQYFEGPLLASRFETVHFADFRYTSSPMLPVTEKRLYKDVRDYYLLNTAFWYSYYLRGDCSNFDATSIAEWGAVIYLDRQDGSFPGNFELGNFSILVANKSGIRVNGNITGRDAWLRVTTGNSLTLAGKLDFGWADDASRAGIYPQSHTHRVYTTETPYRVNTISVQSRANLTLNEANLDGTLILFEGGNSSITIKTLIGEPVFEVPDGCYLTTSQTDAGTRFSIISDPKLGSRLIFK